MRNLEKLKDDIIEKALREGRLRPVDRELWERRFNEDPKATKRKLKRLPKTILFKEYGKGPEVYEKRARARVEKDKQLRKYAYVLFEDWQGYGPSRYLNPPKLDEYYDHIMWILTAKTKDLVKWAERWTDAYRAEWLRYSKEIRQELQEIRQQGNDYAKFFVLRVEELLSHGDKALARAQLGDACGFQREARELLNIYALHRIFQQVIPILEVRALPLEIEANIRRMHDAIDKLLKIPAGESLSSPRVRHVDSWAAINPLLYQLLPALETAKVIERTERGYDWKRKQVIFLWLLWTVNEDFRDWAGAVRFFTIQGKEKTSAQLRNAYQKLSSHPPAEWHEIEALIDQAKSLPNCK